MKKVLNYVLLVVFFLINLLGIILVTGEIISTNLGFLILVISYVIYLVDVFLSRKEKDVKDKILVGYFVFVLVSFAFGFSNLKYSNSITGESMYGIHETNFTLSLLFSSISIIPLCLSLVIVMKQKTNILNVIFYVLTALIVVLAIILLISLTKQVVVSSIIVGVLLAVYIIYVFVLLEKNQKEMY